MKVLEASRDVTDPLVLPMLQKYNAKLGVRKPTQTWWRAGTECWACDSGSQQPGFICNYERNFSHLPQQEFWVCHPARPTWNVAGSNSGFWRRPNSVHGLTGINNKQSTGGKSSAAWGAQSGNLHSRTTGGDSSSGQFKEQCWVLFFYFFYFLYDFTLIIL